MSPRQSAPKLLLINEYEAVADALEFAAEQARLVTDNSLRWKWVVGGLHNALQGLMVLALRGGDGLAILPDRTARAWLRAHRSGATTPAEKLDTFLNLYSKIKGTAVLQLKHSKRFVPSGSEEGSVHKLHSLRNGFTHFLPVMWAIELSGLPRVCLDCLSVADFLIDHCGNIFWQRKTQHTRAKRAIQGAKASLLLALERLE